MDEQARRVRGRKCGGSRKEAHAVESSRSPRGSLAALRDSTDARDVDDLWSWSSRKTSEGSVGRLSFARIVPFLISLAGWFPCSRSHCRSAPWKCPHLAPSGWAISVGAFIGPRVVAAIPAVSRVPEKGYDHSIMRAINKPTPSVTR